MLPPGAAKLWQLPNSEPCVGFAGDQEHQPAIRLGLCERVMGLPHCHCWEQGSSRLVADPWGGPVAIAHTMRLTGGSSVVEVILQLKGIGDTPLLSSSSVSPRGPHPARQSLETQAASPESREGSLVCLAASCRLPGLHAFSTAGILCNKLEQALLGYTVPGEEFRSHTLRALVAYLYTKEACSANRSKEFQNLSAAT